MGQFATVCYLVYNVHASDLLRFDLGSTLRVRLIGLLLLGRNTAFARCQRVYTVQKIVIEIVMEIFSNEHCSFSKIPTEIGKRSIGY